MDGPSAQSLDVLGGAYVTVGADLSQLRAEFAKGRQLATEFERTPVRMLVSADLSQANRELTQWRHAASQGALVIAVKADAAAARAEIQTIARTAITSSFDVTVNSPALTSLSAGLTSVHAALISNTAAIVANTAAARFSGGGGSGGATFGAWNPATQSTVPLAYDPGRGQFFNTQNGMSMADASWPGGAGRFAGGPGGGRRIVSNSPIPIGRGVSVVMGIREAIQAIESEEKYSREIQRPGIDEKGLLEANVDRRTSKDSLFFGIGRAGRFIRENTYDAITGAETVESVEGTKREVEQDELDKQASDRRRGVLISANERLAVQTAQTTPERRRLELKNASDARQREYAKQGDIGVKSEDNVLAQKLVEAENLESEGPGWNESQAEKQARAKQMRATAIAVHQGRVDKIRSEQHANEAKEAASLAAENKRFDDEQKMETRFAGFHAQAVAARARGDTVGVERATSIAEITKMQFEEVNASPERGAIFNQVTKPAMEKESLRKIAVEQASIAKEYGKATSLQLEASAIRQVSEGGAGSGRNALLTKQLAERGDFNRETDKQFEGVKGTDAEDRWRKRREGESAVFAAKQGKELADQERESQKQIASNEAGSQAARLQASHQFYGARLVMADDANRKELESLRNAEGPVLESTRKRQQIVREAIESEEQFRVGRAVEISGAAGGASLLRMQGRGFEAQQLETGVRQRQELEQIENPVERFAKRGQFVAENALSQQQRNLVVQDRREEITADTQAAQERTKHMPLSAQVTEAVARARVELRNTEPALFEETRGKKLAQLAELKEGINPIGGGAVALDSQRGRVVGDPLGLTQRARDEKASRDKIDNAERNLQEQKPRGDWLKNHGGSGLLEPINKAAEVVANLFKPSDPQLDPKAMQSGAKALGRFVTDMFGGKKPEVEPVGGKRPDVVSASPRPLTADVDWDRPDSRSIESPARPQVEQAVQSDSPAGTPGLFTGPYYGMADDRAGITASVDWEKPQVESISPMRAGGVTEMKPTTADSSQGWNQSTVSRALGLLQQLVDKPVGASTYA